MSNYELQARVMHQSNVMRDTIKSLNDWQKEMKQKEAQTKIPSNIPAFDPSHPIRSHGKETTSDKTEEKKPKTPNNVENANEFKTRGNDCVKTGQYEKAAKYYSEAIRLNKTEAVYYTNRALCYLKQNKFTECIDDCTAAINLDKNAVKAYYRRMQAQEQNENGDIQAALKDCETVLRLEPKNSDAKRSLERIRKRLPSKEPKKALTDSVAWSQFKNVNGYESVDFIQKPPHSRSKEPLQRITIEEHCGKKPKINDELTIKTNSKVESQPVDNDSKPVTQNQTQPVKSVTFQIPKTSAQFFKTWLSLKSVEHKFEVLKGIKNLDACKLFGAQLNLNVVPDILSVLLSSFVPNKLPVLNILAGIAYNSEMQIIAVLMNADDKKNLSSLFEYASVNGENKKKIDAIKKTIDDHFSA